MDIALAVELILPQADYRRSGTYEELKETWNDSRPIPTEAELIEALAGYTLPLPATVSNLAFTESLIESGIFPDAVESLLDQIPDTTERWKAKVRWQQSRIALTDPLLRAQATAMGVTEETLTAIYTRAAEIDAVRG